SARWCFPKAANSPFIWKPRKFPAPPSAPHPDTSERRKGEGGRIRVDFPFGNGGGRRRRETSSRRSRLASGTRRKPPPASGSPGGDCFTRSRITGSGEASGHAAQALGVLPPEDEERRGRR